MGNTSDFWMMKIDDVVRFTFTLPHTATEWLLLCPLTQTFPQKRGRKPFTPFYLLSSHPPSVPWEVALGQKRVAHLSLPLPPPNFTQLHTHTDWNIGAHTNRTHPVNSCTRGDKLGSLSTKRGWGTPTLHTHTHRTIQLHCGQVPLHPRQCTLLPTFKKRNMLLPLWEVESFTSLTEWYRDKQINREKDGECIRWISNSCGNEREPKKYITCVNGGVLTAAWPQGK